MRFPFRTRDEPGEGCHERWNRGEVSKRNEVQQDADAQGIPGSGREASHLQRLTSCAQDSAAGHRPVRGPEPVRSPVEEKEPQAFSRHPDFTGEPLLASVDLERHPEKGDGLCLPNGPFGRGALPGGVLCDRRQDRRAGAGGISLPGEDAPALRAEAGRLQRGHGPGRTGSGHVRTCRCGHRLYLRVSEDGLEIPAARIPVRVYRGGAHGPEPVAGQHQHGARMLPRRGPVRQ